MRKSSFLAVALAAAVLVGCDDVTSGGGNGRLRIYLTDAPGDLQEAFVKIDRIVLIRRDAESTDENSSGRVTITPNTTNFINLLTLTGGQLLELADVGGIPEGTYSEVRVVIDEAYVRLDDGRVFATSNATLPAGVTAAGELKCPSCAASGFKVKFTTTGITINNTSIITIDFDAGKSFGHEAGNSGMWVMHPVLRATSTNIPFARISGNVALAAGVTLPACGGAATTVAQFMPFGVLGADTLNGVTDATGAYTIANLAAGTYTLGYARDLTFTNGDSLTVTAAATPATVTVAAGETGVSNYSITTVTCH
jgi:hypothetical protein